MTNNTVGSIATYSCFTNYMLIGSEERNCTADVGWSGVDPQCCKGKFKSQFIFILYMIILVRICGKLSIEDGNVDTGLSIEGDIANFTCYIGFKLVGDAERVCQSNGQWSGMNPACQGVYPGLSVVAV